MTGETPFEGVLRQIEDSVPFEPGYYNESYLDRRISARMRRRDVDDHTEYERLLREEPDEREALMDALTINVTEFFRNPEMWEVLRGVLREMTETKRQVNVWSAPCADGREPYSAAMLACDDPEIDERRLSVLGTDISDEALENARAGVYHTTRTTDIAAELEPLSAPEQWVDRDGDSFRVRDPVKELVEFEKHDLIRDGQMSAFDVVFCRNLLIYIDSGHKGDVFDTLESSLSPGSVLVVGMTESVPPDRRDRYEPVNKRRRVFRWA
ncbi:Methylase of chemotaxis methyl-accepting protein [Halalkaliarchaeum sp. AArc-CO]|uniref:CheR family methyltransferase n=1 Tax=Halalkaliarchaeum sp. AArc-CO TaxID=2866381 RepID=UPI00217CCA79|nr:protein-glutamate O-methyltransferase CheR [Halalkaliarchaeum sp. AArc-CO]UWG52243.1 Methylase of chemotaxis methyl-accepting protein [Halalkaliarchaeum sp. AArc-CO]